MKNIIIGTIAVWTALNFGVASASDTVKIDYTNKFIYQLRLDASAVRKVEQHIKETVPDKATQREALKVTASTLRELNTIKELVQKIKESHGKDGLYMDSRNWDDRRNYAQIALEIKSGDSNWCADLGDLQQTTWEEMRQTGRDVRDITGISGDILHEILMKNINTFDIHLSSFPYDLY